MYLGAILLPGRSAVTLDKIPKHYLQTFPHTPPLSLGEKGLESLFCISCNHGMNRKRHTNYVLDTLYILSYSSPSL